MEIYQTTVRTVGELINYLQAFPSTTFLEIQSDYGGACPEVEVWHNKQTETVILK